MDVFLIVLTLAVCAALAYVGYRIEPHYVSKNGRRFLSAGQQISAHGEAEGRKREVWITVLADGQLLMDVKHLMRRNVSQWSIEAKAAEAPRKRVLYVLRSRNADGSTQRMTIQLPSKSRAVAVLDEALAMTR